MREPLPPLVVFLLKILPAQLFFTLGSAGGGGGRSNASMLFTVGES